VFENIVVGLDGSERGDDAAAVAGIVARTTGAKVTLLHVIDQAFPDHVSGPERYTWSAEEQREGGFDRAQELLRVPSVTREVLLAPSAAAGLHWVARDELADLVVVGPSHRGPVGRVLVGAVGERLLHGSPCAVAVAPRGCHERSLERPAVIGIAFDASPGSREALGVAAVLARQAGAAVRILAVLDGALVPLRARLADAATRAAAQAELRDGLRGAVDAAATSLPTDVEVQTSVLDGKPAETLIEQSRAGLDLLFCGSRGYGPLRTVLLGGVSHLVVRGAACPVIVVPRPALGSDGLPEETAG
jgi:nucleotide-binding universal stress UspA family protein